MFLTKHRSNGITINMTPATSNKPWDISDGGPSTSSGYLNSQAVLTIFECSQAVYKFEI